MSGHKLTGAALDKKIIAFLEKAPCHPSEISRRIGVLRTTIQYRLIKLEMAGLVSKKTIGKKTVWRLAGKTISGKKLFSIYHGHEMIHAYQELLSLPKNSVVLSVQGYKSASSEIKKLPSYFIEEAHKTFVRKNIVMRGISNSSILKIFKTVNPPLLKSHIKRGIGVHLITGNSFLGAGEIMSTKDFLLISNPSKKRAIIIKEKALAEIVFETMSLLFDSIGTTRVFNLKDYIESILK